MPAWRSSAISVGDETLIDSSVSFIRKGVREVRLELHLQLNVSSSTSRDEIPGLSDESISLRSTPYLQNSDQVIGKWDL